MGLILKAFSGPLQGQSFAVRGEMIIGRQDATINLNDPKVSSVHARITNADGPWRVLDNNSKNGVRNAQGDRIDSLELVAGAIFHIGESGFEVAEAPETPKAAGADPGFVEAKKEKKKARYWHEILWQFLETNAAKFKNKESALAPLEPGLILEFVRGVQTNSKWILGYGPRRIGPVALDLPIWEPGAPEVCFEIHPTPQGLLFKTQHPQIVKLNGQEIDNELLRMGDTIKINETLIEVDFVE
ncbi:MAG: FHA domain-containing protein [Bdellovibrionales bacterium]|nr:FHA domain-containing protein [Bdellovibrionales bacterium]